MGDGQQLRTRDHRADDAVVMMPEVAVALVKKVEQTRIAVLADILANKFRHLGIVRLLRGGMHGVSARVSAEVAIETGTNVIQLVGDRDELFLERLVEKPWQAEGHDVKDLPLVKKESLHLILGGSMSPGQAAAAESQRGGSRLQTEAAEVSGRRERDEHRRHADVSQDFTTTDHVVAHLTDLRAEVQRRPGRIDAKATASVRSRRQHPLHRQWSVARMPVKFLPGHSAAIPQR